MEGEIISDNKEAVRIQFSAGAKMIKDYTFLYSIVNFNIHSNLRLIFPRVGYLILNLFIGNGFTCKFLDYDSPEIEPGQLYITGLFTKPLLYEIAGKGKGYAMKIHPVIGYHFLKEPIYQLNNQQYLISSIMGKAGHLLRTLEEDGKMDCLGNDYFEQFLLKHLPDRFIVQNDPIYRAVNTIISRKGMVSVKNLAAQFNMTERTLNRQFLHKVGLSPKTYAMIWRWQCATELLQNCPAISLQDLAYKSGYYDIAHLAHDFKNITLQTPTEFHRNIDPLLENYFNFPESLQ